MKYSEIIKNNIDFMQAIALIPPLSLKHITVECLRLHDVMNSRDQWLDIAEKYLKDYDPNTQLHSHSWYEFSFVDRGRINYFTEDKSFKLSEGDLFLMPPGIRHGWTALTDEYLILGFHLRVKSRTIAGDEILKALHQKLAANSYHLKASDLISDTVKSIRSTNRERRLSQVKLEAMVRILLYEFIEQAFAELLQKSENSDIEKNRNQDICQQIIQIVSENLHLPLQLDDIAWHFELTSRHLNRIFTEIEGLSIGKYILQEKMSAARDELVNTDHSIKHIAFSYGFSQASYFCRIFKKRYGECEIVK